MHNHTKAVRSMLLFGDRQIEGFLLPETLWTPRTKYGASKTQAVMIAYSDCDRSQAAKRYIEKSQ